MKLLTTRRNDVKRNDFIYIHSIITHENTAIIGIDEGRTTEISAETAKI